MTISRRQFLGRALLASAAPLAAAPIADELETWAAQEASALAAPPIEVLALSKMAYGHRPGDLARVQAMGLQAYVDEQLAPDDSLDTDCNARIAAAKLRIRYSAGASYPAVDEDRPLSNLNASLAQLWALQDHPAFGERVRPADEVQAATWIRAVYSRWQLREVLAEFWHNHFNVNAYADQRIACTWPLYDRDVIRAHSLGNFRAFLEAVAQSTAMQYYLDNVTSKDGPANENYARELFELHTLGADNYFPNTRTEDVPVDAQGRPTGYIDEDVHEAARCFTGWTIEDGSYIGGGLYFPDTGLFRYYAGWHDLALKYVLGTVVPSNQPPMTDGRKVLDLVAYHPGTARHICTKLCRRLVADNPPAALVDRAVTVWMRNQTQPDQIKRTVRAILLSPEFAATWGAKVRRPFELVAAFLRATDANFVPNSQLFYSARRAGYALFQWPTPNGHPDTAGAWLSTNVMLQRWNLVLDLMSSWFGAATFNMRGQMPAAAQTSRQIVDFWVQRLLGRQVDSTTYQELLKLMSQGRDPDTAPTGSDTDLKERIDNLVSLICMTPDFQWR